MLPALNRTQAGKDSVVGINYTVNSPVNICIVAMKMLL